MNLEGKIQLQDKAGHQCNRYLKSLLALQKVTWGINDGKARRYQINIFVAVIAKRVQVKAQKQQ